MIDETVASSILRKCWPKYQLIDPIPIGWGAYGTVFRVRSDEMVRAVKIMRLSVQRSRGQEGITSATEVLQREWNMLQTKYEALSYCNVLVRVHDFHKEEARTTGDGRLAEAYGAILMDYWPWDLDRYLADYPTLSADYKQRILEGIAGLLERLYTGQKYLYTDLKPGNILVRVEGQNSLPRLVLGDIGGLKSVHSLSNALMDVTNAYSAPEVVPGRKFPNDDAALRAMVWSFGLLGCFVFQGYLPFEEEGAEERAKKIRDHGLPLDSMATSGLGRAVSTVKRCLQYDPALRPSNFVEVLALLKSRNAEETVKPKRAIPAAETLLREDKLSVKSLPQEKIGQTWVEPNTGQLFVWIPPGEFLMGQTDAEKRYLQDNYSNLYKKHFFKEQKKGKPFPVKIESGFWLAKTTVTVGQFRQFVTSSGYKSDAERNVQFPGSFIFKDNQWQSVMGADWRNPGFEQQDNHPVVCVSWNDACAFIEWLNTMAGNRMFRLPTEAEWEYAARAGTTTIRYWGDDLGETEACQYANVATADHWGGGAFKCKSTHKYTLPVGMLWPNPFGLCDMLGNVWEWTCSDYGQYEDEGKNYAKCSKGGSFRVYRGGSWHDNPAYVRSALRYGNVPGYRNSLLGFRLARTFP